MAQAGVPYGAIGGGFPGGGLTPSQPTPPSQLSLGYGIGMTNGPPRNVPPLGLGGFGPSTASNAGNTEMSFNANQTLPHHYITLPSVGNRDDEAWAGQLGVGMLVFARQIEGDEAVGTLPHGARYTGGMSAHIDPSSTMLLEWTQLCQWLTKYSQHFKTAEQVAAEWKIAGVVKVEVAPNRDTNYGRRSANRLLNVIVGQRVSTFNIFGLSVIEGTPLYLIIKKEPVDAIFFGEQQEAQAHQQPDGGPKRTRQELDSDAPPVNQVRKYVWKLIPYADKHRHKPGLQHLAYYDVSDSGEVYQAVGKAIYVGMASASAPPSALYGNKIGLANSNERITLFKRGMLPNVEIYCGV